MIFDILVDIGGGQDALQRGVIYLGHNEPPDVIAHGTLMLIRMRRINAAQWLYRIALVAKLEDGTLVNQ